ncbi:MFS general substrate transporter [Xylariaceae sp. FL1651]|nr:MFS general substrate transporter [Xylariaceae sp. FL1651]
MAQPEILPATAGNLVVVGEHEPYDETTPLRRSLNSPRSRVLIVPSRYVHRVLFLSFSASVAIAATAATTVYAYAFILCKDPTRCENGEKSSYTGASALATIIANTCGILALGPLQRIMKPRPKVGLYLWTAARASSVAFLAVAVTYKSIALALVGRVFEGLATDNLLHFILSTIYISVGDTDRFSQLMGTSLALYMCGMFLSPIVAGLLPNFFISFLMALSTFLISIIYIALFVPVVEKDSCDTGSEMMEDSRTAASRGFHAVVGPLMNLFSNKGALVISLALLSFNTSQAYLFPALMVFGSLRFSFTATQNGYLISIAAGVSALYLLTVSYGLPKLRNRGQMKQTGMAHNDGLDEEEQPESVVQRKFLSRDFLYAILSLSVQLAALPCIFFTTVAWQVFILVGLLALGLAAPSFIKSHGATLVDDGPAAVASWAMLESIGGLLSAVILGAWQHLIGSDSVFFLAAGLVGTAVILVMVS